MMYGKQTIYSDNYNKFSDNYDKLAYTKINV